MMGTSVEALTLVFKPHSCDSPQNFKDVFDAVAEDKCENQPKKRKQLGEVKIPKICLLRV